MSAYTPPDDVRPGRATGTVLEGRTPIGCPGQLEDGRRALHASHSQPRAELAGAEVGDEDPSDSSEASPFVCREMIPVTVEPGGPLPGGHLAERSQEVLIRVEALCSPGCDVFRGLALAGLPVSLPEPGL